MFRVTTFWFVVLLVAAGIGQASSHRSGSAAKQVLQLQTASGAALKFSASSLRANAGLVAIALKNRGFMPHNIVVKGNGVNVKGKVVPSGGTSTVTVKLKKGRYEFYCSVPGHEQAGMKGTLTVG